MKSAELEGISDYKYTHLHLFIYLYSIYPIFHTDNITNHFPGYASSEEIGCYADVPRDRDLPYEELLRVPGGMTQEICAAHCGSKVG